MNIVDLGILLMIIVPALIGLWCGAVTITIFELTWGLAGYCSWTYRQLLVPFYSAFTAHEGLQIAASFLTLLVLIVIIGTIIGGLVKSGIKKIGLGAVDRFLGLGFGAAAGVLLVVLSVMVAKNTELPTQDDWKKSLFMPFFDQLSVEFGDWFKKQGFEMPKMDVEKPQNDHNVLNPPNSQPKSE